MPEIYRAQRKLKHYAYNVCADLCSVVTVANVCYTAYLYFIQMYSVAHTFTVVLKLPIHAYKRLSQSSNNPVILYINNNTSDSSLLRSISIIASI